MQETRSILTALSKKSGGVPDVMAEAFVLACEAAHANGWRYAEEGGGGGAGEGGGPCLRLHFREADAWEEEQSNRPTTLFVVFLDLRESQASFPCCTSSFSLVTSG